MVTGLSTDSRCISGTRCEGDLIRGRSTHYIYNCICTKTNPYRDAASLIFDNTALVTRGNSITTRKGEFSFRGRVICTSLSVRGLSTLHEGGVSFSGGVNAIRVMDTPIRGGRGSLGRHFISPRPFIPTSSGVHHREYHRVFTVRSYKLTGEVSRINSTNTVINVSNKLSSALTLLITTRTVGELNGDTTSVVKVAVPNFNAANEACGGTLRLVYELNIRVGRVSVGTTYRRRVHSVRRGSRVRSVACRGARTERHARVLFSVTGGRGVLLINANSLDRLTVN